MPWASDKIRVFYRAGLLNERILGKKMDSRKSRRLEETPGLVEDDDT